MDTLATPENTDIYALFNNAVKAFADGDFDKVHYIARYVRTWWDFDYGYDFGDPRYWIGQAIDGIESKAYDVEIKLQELEDGDESGYILAYYS